jgi:hypothetical protein
MHVPITYGKGMLRQMTASVPASALEFRNFCSHDNEDALMGDRRSLYLDETTKRDPRMNLSVLTYGLELPVWDTSLGLLLWDNLRWISGQNSFTTIAIVSYPTCVPHTLAVFGRVRSDAL